MPACQRIPGLDLVTVVDFEFGSNRNNVFFFHHPGFISKSNPSFTAVVTFNYLDLTRNLTYHRGSFGSSGFKKFLDTGQPLSNVQADNTTQMESTHGQLGPWLTNRLSRNYPHRSSDR